MSGSWTDGDSVRWLLSRQASKNKEVGFIRNVQGKKKSQRKQPTNKGRLIVFPDFALYDCTTTIVYTASFAHLHNFGT